MVLPGFKVVALVLMSATGVMAFVDANAFMDAIERFGESILGVVVDAPERESTAPPTRLERRGW